MEELQFQCSPEQAKDDEFISTKIKSLLKLNSDAEVYYTWHKRSIDARKKNIKINCVFKVSTVDPIKEENQICFKPLNTSKTVHIIGMGPAGMFAALHAIKSGIKPIIYERGKNVRDRRRDLAKLNKEGLVNPESNYCFGEGGAGTYSDGKLYTRSKKRGDVREVLKLLVQFGAEKDILIDAHPHIGTNKLPHIISAINEKIISCGGEIHFNCRLTDIHIQNEKIKEITINEELKVNVSNIILATGHSARDIYELLHKKGVKLLAKPFALGVRIEHTQDFIDQAQYGRLNDEFLPPASYKLATQIDDKGVYSFCMCPGGIIAPCATAQDEVVTNGWSPSKRNNPYSNAGIVVSVTPQDVSDSESPFTCLDFQKEIEHRAWTLAGKNQKVPAQCLLDFIQDEKSKHFPRSSYQPGIESVKMDDLFPEFICNRLRKGFIEFNKKIPGFISNDAVIHAPESRTSSPILIPRDKEQLHHLELKNLYPCAEGAGYAGGIVSAAIDGMNCMLKLAHKEGKTN